MAPKRLRYVLITGCGPGGIGEALAQRYRKHGYTMPATDIDIATVKEMFDVNVFGPMKMVREFHGMIVKSRGTVVNIGSIGGVIPYPYGSCYNATKAALHHWSSTLRVEMAPFEVKVLTVISGEIGTNFLKADKDRELPKATTNRFEYAGKVVAVSLNSAPPAWFWYGHATFLTRLIDTLAPRKFWDYLLSGMFNFGKLRRVHQEMRDVASKENVPE
ncbi:hypothetical protein F5Y15DRAFT_261727 [Xylariaceae sp. FL0016]|nr:hypothetical protein F5Y15DRAFT_261727 [Xylariaceae sp. FL0016]